MATEYDFSGKKFVDQISILSIVSGRAAEFNQVAWPSSFFAGLFGEGGFKHNFEVLRFLFSSKDGRFKIEPGKKLALELPQGGGKTRTAFAAAFLGAVENGGHALVVYPSEAAARRAFAEFREYLRGLRLTYLDIIYLLDDQHPHLGSRFYCPGILVTDVFNLHTHLLAEVLSREFYGALKLIVLEDLDKYRDEFGANCAYLFRRLLCRAECHGTPIALLGTMTPVRHKERRLKALTSFDDVQIVNVDSQKRVEHRWMTWHLPITAMEVDPLNLKRSGFSDELSALVKGVLKQKACIVIYWKRAQLTSDEINKVRKEISPPDNQELFIGNDLENITQALRERGKSWGDVDAFLVIDNTDPLLSRLLELDHLGNDGSEIIFFSSRTPSIQYQIYRQLDDPLFAGQPPLYPGDCRVRYPERNVTEKQADFLKEEMPNISPERLNKYFDDDFCVKFRSPARNARFGNYLFLNEGLAVYPKGNRSHEQLLHGDDEAVFSLMLNDGNLLGKVDKCYVYAYCYKGASIAFLDKLFRIEGVDYGRRRISAVQIPDYSPTTKIATYAVRGEVGAARSLNYFGDLISIGSSPRPVSERILGCKSGPNIQSYEQDGFIDEEMPVLTIDFSKLPLERYRSQILDKLRGETGQDETWVSQYNLIHTMGHLLLEMARTLTRVEVEAVKFAIDIDDADHICRLHIIDLSGQQKDLFEILENMLVDLFRMAFEVLRECPCNRGTSVCVHVDYCNIPRCHDQTEKLPVLVVMGHILAAAGDRIDIERILHHKVYDRIIDPEGEGRSLIALGPGQAPEAGAIITQGILRDQVYKLNQMESRVKGILSQKMLIDIPKEEYYDSFFMTRERMHDLTQIFGVCPLGTTDLRGRNINYMPGLNESVLYQVMFHERFHNYQQIDGNFSHDVLTFFDWLDVDNVRSIPFGGLLVVEGSAQYVTVRGMEFFDYIEDMEFVSQISMLEYRSGINMFFNMEKDLGYFGILDILKTGFDIAAYKECYYPEIYRRIEALIRAAPLQLRCIQQNNTLGSRHGNRLSYFFQRGRLNYLERAQRISRYSHGRLTVEQAMALAASPAPNVLAPQFRDVWLQFGLWDTGWREAGRDNPICASCQSGCTFHDACMLNGGELVIQAYLNASLGPVSQI